MKTRKQYVDPMIKLYEEYRKHPVCPYRERHYTPKVRGKNACKWWFEIVRGVINGGYAPENYRTVGITICCSGGRDWEGSCYKNTLAHFVHIAGGGWTLNSKSYSTLLRAVRAWKQEQGE